MEQHNDVCLAVDDIYLPADGIDMHKWAVVACDQYTSQPEYWHEVEQLVGDAPSTLKLIYPEAFLSEGDARIDAINSEMARYIDEDVIQPRVHGFILTERECEYGARVGLIAPVDLEAYDFSVGSRSPIRATEGTILERIPPRVRIRRGAPIELPHIMMLLDDALRTVIEPLYEMRESLSKVYDFELMQGGGHIRGWAVEGEAVEFVLGAMKELRERCGDIFIAVGDGNHSLATARQCWLDMRDNLTPEQREQHPARYALCELVNLHSEALVFEPVHRVLFGAEMGQVLRDFSAWCERGGMRMERGARAGHVFRFVNGRSDMTVTVSDSRHAIDVGTLQSFLDEWVKLHPEVSMDFVHGEQALRGLAAREDCCGILLQPMNKANLFPAVEQGGALPRKTFSMGEAHEKRFYLECRRITAD
ncbi:MAG: DUF1015 domain-containing protein [Candidatus Fimadaptatus sp.]|jgi:hypothetical protein